MTYIKIIMINVFILMSISVHSEKYIPKNFGDLFEVKPYNIKIILPNNVYGNVDVNANYDSLVSIDSKEFEKIELLFSQADIKKEFLNLFKNNDLSTLKFISFDFDSLTAKINVPVEFMGKSGFNNSKFTNIKPDQNAIINDFSLFLNGQGSSEISSSLYHDTILGFGNGFIEYEGNLDSSYKLYKIIAEYNIKGFEIVVGKGKYLSTQSDANIFDFTSPNNKKMAQISTSNNLRELEKSSYKSIYFDMDTKGIVRGYRNDRIIFTRVVKAGTNKIKYTDLPKGNYTLKLIIEPENSNKKIEEYRIFNNVSSNDLNENNYTVSVNEVDVFENNYRKKYVDLSYVRAVEDSDMILGGTAKVSDRDTLIGIGYKDSILNDSININLYTDISSNASFKNFDMNYKNLTFSWVNQSYSKFDDCRTLFCSLYGVNDLNEIALNYSDYFFRGRFSIFYKLADEYNNNTNRKLNYSTLSANYNINLYKNIFADFYYRTRKDLKNYSSINEHTFGVSFNIPIESGMYLNTVIEGNKGNTSITNAINYSDDLDLIDGMQLNTTIGNTYTSSDSEMKDFETLGLNYNSDKINSSLYFNNYNGELTSSLTLSTNVVSDYNSIFFSSENDKSYLIINSDYEREKHNVDLGDVTITKNNITSFNRKLENGSVVIGLTPFDKYDYSLDIESSGFTSFDSNYLGSTFSYPGTISIINNSMIKVKTFLTFFESFYGNTSKNITCVGRGCSEVSEVGDGVYSVSIVENVPFKIVADGEVCLINNETYQKNNGKSYCFPKIKELDNGMQLVIDDGDEEYNMYYLGVIDKKLPKELLSVAKASNIKIIKKKFGTSHNYFFAKIKKDNDIVFDYFKQMRKYTSNNNELKNTESLVNVL
ncbi:TPA: TcfC E-set like domain-containing protein [Photobacterium damselae]